MDQNNLNMKFSPVNVDFSSLSLDPVRPEMFAHVGVKKRYPQSGYLSDIGLSIVKTVADRHNHVAYHNKH